MQNSFCLNHFICEFERSNKCKVFSYFELWIKLIFIVVLQIVKNYSYLNKFLPCIHLTAIVECPGPTLVFTYSVIVCISLKFVWPLPYFGSNLYSFPVQFQFPLPLPVPFPLFCIPFLAPSAAHGPMDRCVIIIYTQVSRALSARGLCQVCTSSIRSANVDVDGIRKMVGWVMGGGALALHVAHVAAITRNNHHNQKSQHEMSFDLLLPWRITS